MVTNLPPIKILLKKYNLSKKDLFLLMHECIKYYLSEEELYEIILERQLKKEIKLNKKEQM